MLKQQVDASYDSAHWMFCQRLRYKTLNRPKTRSGKAISRRDRNPLLYCYAEVTNVQEELLWLFAVRFLLKALTKPSKCRIAVLRGACMSRRGRKLRIVGEQRKAFR